MIYANHEDILSTTFPFAKFKNMFESNKDIGDEIRYVFDRQSKDSQMGNTLDRPSILMKQNLTRITQTKQEVLQAGTSYTQTNIKKQEVGDSS